MKEGDEVWIKFPAGISPFWDYYYPKFEVLPAHSIRITIKSINPYNTSLFYFKWDNKERIGEIGWIEDPFITAVREASESEDQTL